ncbi:CdiA family toxin C-terminal domain-containing protein [Paenibacillus sp. chi10]|uniref:CdiA family toxin C-terminal domain-containing protein n=1 Tax=Paenibacillus suaedae TaxID=3077233 RepID=A0AAJ2NB15_9BACL|nr:CdiA family toxin C-terminal domain-containing protein [Paenibacillus sp. chi10]MDT8979319.1 CdiA family toxin C-terminal domain-containing protein [Paenibacillus sp. chi10]
MGKKIAEVGAQTGEEIWSGVKKTGNSFAEIGIDFWNGLEVRNNNKFDSLYDFGNWLTVGSFDEVGSRIEGYKTRADMRNESPYDYVNWLSSGIAGSFKEAFNPDDPLSKEHWMGSFDVFTLILGAKGAAPKGSGPTLPKVNAKTPVPTVNWGIKERLEAFQQSASQLSKNKLVYDGPNANYKSSTQKPLEPTKNQIEVRKYYPGSNPETSASGSKNKKSSGEGTGNGVPVIKNNFEYVDSFDDHMINAQGIVRKGNKGVVGGHSLESFEKILSEQGWKLDDVIVSRTPHPTVAGVYEIEYRLPALDRELKVVPGQYKNIPQPKTVYDPIVISNEQMIVWGKEAMENGVINGRLVTGYSSNGLRFTGYLNDSGNITNFHPSFEGK